ncbi:MAG: hypothetical protein AAF206_12145 [Bacteroidota bacterium]
MRTINLFSLLLLSVTLSLGQSTPSEEWEANRWWPDWGFNGAFPVKVIPIGHHDGEQYEFAVHSRDNIVIRRRPLEGGTETASVLPMRFQGMNRRLIDVKLVRGRLFMFSSYDVFLDKENHIMVDELDIKSLRWIGGPRTVLWVQESRPVGTRIDVSPDQSKIVVFAPERNKKRELLSYSYRVFDHNMNPTWSRTHQLPFSRQQCEIGPIFLNDQGDLIVSSRLRSRSDQPEEKMYLLAHQHGGHDATFHEIDFHNEVIQSFRLHFAADGTAMVDGVYEQVADQQRGSFRFTIDAVSGKMSPIRRRPFIETEPDPKPSAQIH